MRRTRVYVETSVFDFFYGEDERYAIRKEVTRKFFDQISQEEFVAIGSDLVMEELERVPEPYKESLMGLLERFDLEKIVVEEEEMNRLSKIYIDGGLIPKEKENIAKHLAIATIGEVDILATWNFKLLVNEFKARNIKAINLKEGYVKELSLRTPEELIME